MIFFKKEEANDINIQNMSDDDFLKKSDFSFWQQFHLQEKKSKKIIK